MCTMIIWTITACENDFFYSMGAFLGKIITIPESSRKLIMLPQSCLQFEAGPVSKGVYATIKDCNTYFQRNNNFAPLALTSGTTLLHHNWKEIPGNELIPAGVTILDYSSTDVPHYQLMCRDLQHAQTEEALLRVAVKWVRAYKQHFRDEPIGLIRHRAINIFTPTDRYIQAVHHTLASGAIDTELVIREMKRKWLDPLNPAASPLTAVRRLWYSLTGDQLNWKIVGGERPGGVALPKDRNGNDLDLYNWIQLHYSRNGFTELESWWKLLAHAGLAEAVKGFDIRQYSEILCFCKVFESIICGPQTETWLKALVRLAPAPQKETPLDFLWELTAKISDPSQRILTIPSTKIPVPEIHRTLESLHYNSPPRNRHLSFNAWFRELRPLLNEIEKISKTN